MDLQEKLQELQQDNTKNRIVKIGMVKASGFVHCYYLNDMTIERLKKESINYLASLKTRLKRKQELLEELPTRKERALKVAINKCYGNEEHPKTPTIAEVELARQKVEISYDKQEKQLYRLIGSLKSNIGIFTPWLSRKVVNCYRSDYQIEPNTMIIIVKGNESGKYWNIDEYAIAKKLNVLLCDRHKDYAKQWKRINLKGE